MRAKKRKDKRNLKANPKSPVGKPIGEERARELSLMRRTFAAGPGRPRSGGPYCFCGKMTLDRAIKRNHNCDMPELIRRREEGQQV